MIKPIKTFLIIGFFIFYLIFMILNFLRLRKRDYKRKYYYYGYKEKKSRFIPFIYKYLEQFWLTKGYITELYKQFDIYCPGNIAINQQKTLITFLCIWGIGGIEFLTLYLLNIGFFNGIITVLIIWVTNMECIYFITRRAELNLLRQMEKFFEDVRHYYYHHDNVDLAILDGIKQTGHEMKAHGNLIYKVLNEKNTEEEVRNYNEMIKINHLKLFLASCVQVKEYGDTYKEEISVFQSNMHHLKNEIHNEILKLKKLMYLFTGKIFMTVSPVLTLTYLKSFGIDILPEMSHFYEGTLGMVIIIVSILLVLICYTLQTYLRDLTPKAGENGCLLYTISRFTPIRIILDNYTERYYTNVLRLKEKLKQTGEKLSYRQFLVKQFLYGIFTFLFMIITLFQIHEIKKHHICNYVDNIDSITSGIHPNQLPFIKNNIVDYVDRFKEQKYISSDVIKRTIQNEVKARSDVVKDVISNEVCDRVIKYQKEYFKWYEVLISFFFSIAAYYFPYGVLMYKHRLIRKNMDQEVVQFQSIVLLFMYLDNISILTILETMELFSVVFKQSIQRCINNFNSGSEAALNQLKENEPYETFVRLIDNFIISDKIGIIKAFDEVASERGFFLERRKQENEIELEKKAANSKAIAYIPLIFIFACYLIIPFTIKCMEDYKMIQYEMQANTLIEK